MPAADGQVVTGFLPDPLAVSIPVVQGDVIGAGSGQLQFPVDVIVLYPGIEPDPQRGGFAEGDARCPFVRSDQGSRPCLASISSGSSWPVGSIQ